MEEERYKVVGAVVEVTLTIEIDADGSWGSECAIDQVERQAARSALGKIAQINQWGATGSERVRVRVIGEPQVTTVLVRRKP